MSFLIPLRDQISRNSPSLDYFLSHTIGGR
jgi:hypothetical protein